MKILLIFFLYPFTLAFAQDDKLPASLIENVTKKSSVDNYDSKRYMREGTEASEVLNNAGYYPYMEPGFGGQYPVEVETLSNQKIKITGTLSRYASNAYYCKVKNVLSYGKKLKALSEADEVATRFDGPILELRKQVNTEFDITDCVKVSTKSEVVTETSIEPSDVTIESDDNLSGTSFSF